MSVSSRPLINPPPLYKRGHVNGHRLEEKQIVPDNLLKNSPLTPSHEPGSYTPIPREVRQEIIDILAAALVEDYQRDQVVAEPTVTESSLFDRRLKLVKSGEKAG